MNAPRLNWEVARCSACGTTVVHELHGSTRPLHDEVAAGMECPGCEKRSMQLVTNPAVALGIVLAANGGEA